MTTTEIRSQIDERLAQVKAEIIHLEDARHALLGTKRRGRKPKVSLETQKAPQSA